MKKTTCIFLAVMLVASILSGCASNIPQDTTGNITPSTTDKPASPSTTVTTPSGTQGGQTQMSVQVLQSIWDQFGEGERFSAYGGSLENAVDNAPGGLDVTDREEMTARYLIPQEQLASIQEAASLVHMMNSNIFSAVALKLTDGADAKAFQKAWRDAIQGNQWICGQPDRLLMAETDDGYLIMAFGSADILKPFAQKLTSAHAQAKTVYDEAIVA